MKQSQEVLVCDFCLKSQHDVASIVVGAPPSFPAACGECIGVLVSALPVAARLAALACVDRKGAEPVAMAEKLTRISENLSEASARARDAGLLLHRIATGVSEEPE